MNFTTKEIIKGQDHKGKKFVKKYSKRISE